VAERSTAEARRESIRRVAGTAFAASGLHGVSVATIAAEVGISEAYVFSLFGSKRALFIDVVVTACDELTEGIAASAAGLGGADALTAMGRAYVGLLADRQRLLLPMQGFAACSDPVIRAAMQDAFGRLWATAARSSGSDDVTVKTFVALGMLTNTLAALDVDHIDSDWARAARGFVPLGYRAAESGREPRAASRDRQGG